MWHRAEAVTSDVAFRASGPDLDALFTAAADATRLMLRFLEELVFYKDARQLLRRATDVHIERGELGYTGRATLVGEPIDPAKHELDADVKAVALHGLAVRRTEAGWEAEVTLDV
jgi:SHS2 domain-containing protein